MTNETGANRPGDIDGDGKIDQSDLALLKQILNDSGYGEALIEKLSPEDRARLDVNHDGSINELDLKRLCEIMMSDNQESASHLANKLQALRNKD